MLHDHPLIISKPLRTLPANITGWQMLRVILGLILLTAALFKVHELSSTPYLDKFPPRWVMIVFTELEILFALWLFFVPKKLAQLTWLVTLGLFSFFACVTLSKALMGEASCGCFGRVEINPWYTLIFDFTVVGLLLWFRPFERKKPFFRSIWRAVLSMRFLRNESGAANLLTVRTLAIGALWLIFCIPSAWSMVSFVETDAHGDLSTLGQVFKGPDGKPIVLLEPEKWAGKRFPLLPFIEGVPGQRKPGKQPLRERLTKGHWIVVLYHYDCPECQKAIGKYKKQAKYSVLDSREPRVVFLEIPPYGEINSLQSSLDIPYTLGKLCNKEEWFVQTPVIVELVKGLVSIRPWESGSVAMLGIAME